MRKRQISQTGSMIIEKDMLKLITGVVKDMKPYILDLFKFQFLILRFGLGCAITVQLPE